MSDEIAREAVGLFHDEKALQRAVDDLLIAGVDRSACSLLAGRRTLERRLGLGRHSVIELEDDERAPRVPYIGTDSRTEAKGVAIGGLAYVGAVASLGVVVFSGGTMAAALGAAAALGGVGGLLGAALATYLGRASRPPSQGAARRRRPAALGVGQGRRAGSPGHGHPARERRRGRAWPWPAGDAAGSDRGRDVL
jgi:hypothetical protein